MQIDESLEQERKIEEVNRIIEQHRFRLNELEKDLCESDNEQAYPTLNKLPGSPFAHIPKKILAVAQEENHTYYLCSWH